MNVNTFAEDVVLRYWKDSDEKSYFNRQFPYNWQFQRFDLDGPCKIKQMTLYLFGQPANMTVVLLGHQGGSPLPQVFAYGGKGILAAAQFPFAGNTQQPATINLPLQTPIEFYGDQVFVGVSTDNPDNTFFLTATTTLAPACESEDGGKFGFQTLANFNAQATNEMWATAPYSFLCDLTVEYTGEQSGYFSDRTMFTSLPPNMPSNTTAWADYNRDGLLDLLVAGRLFAFNSKGEYSEMTNKVGISGTPMANAFIDIDNDQDLDILFLNTSPTKSRIYINDGIGNFTGKDLSLPNLSNVSGFSIADVDSDGYPDLFVTQLWSTYPTALPNYFFQNNKNGGFTAKSGLCTTFSPRRSRGCAFIDFDDDGDLDLYVTNYYQEQDELYENKGDLVFTNIIDSKGIDKFSKDGKDYSNHGTGVDWYDFDNDGDLDLLLPQFAHPLNLSFGFQGTTIYRNSNGKFTDTWDLQELRNSLGIEYEETHAGGAWGDIDNDGLVDLIMTTYYGCRYIDLYKHNYDHTFSNITFPWGLKKIVTGDDACWADYDGDGKLDLALSQDRKFKLFKNTFNSGKNWLELDLTSETGNFYAIGARVKVYVQGKIYTQEVSSGRGQNMQKPSRLHFGLGDASKIDKVEIRWPGTKTYVTYQDIKINQLNSIFNKSVSVTETGNLSESDFLKIIGPQPAESYLEAEFSISSSVAHIEISIFNLKGQFVERILNDNYTNGNYNLRINTSKYTAGTYFLRFSNGMKSDFKSFVIQK